MLRNNISGKCVLESFNHLNKLHVSWLLLKHRKHRMDKGLLKFRVTLPSDFSVAISLQPWGERETGNILTDTAGRMLTQLEDSGSLGAQTADPRYCAKIKQGSQGEIELEIWWIYNVQSCLFLFGETRTILQGSEIWIYFSLNLKQYQQCGVLFKNVNFWRKIHG